MTAIYCIFKVLFRYSSRIVVVTAIALLLCGMPRAVYASYTTACVTPINLFVDPGDITINTDDTSQYPVGTLIGVPYVDNYEYIFAFNGKQCSIGNGSSTWAESGKASVGTYSSPDGQLPVYPLEGADGFGYALYVADPNQAYQALQQNPTKPLWSDTHVVSAGHLGERYKFYLVTTSPLAPGIHRPTVNATLAKTCLSSSKTSNTRDICSILSNNSFTITVNTGGCDINADTPSIVNLDRINASELPRKGDVGNDVGFTINLKCNAATTVNMTLTDPNGGDAENGVLYSDKGDGLAENVGVQVLSVKDGGQTPQNVHLNETFTVGNASEGQYSIPMSARYYRTSDSAIVGGKVSASVIYELSYQ